MTKKELITIIKDMIAANAEDMKQNEEIYEEYGELGLIGSGFSPTDTFEQGYNNALQWVLKVAQKLDE